MVQRITSNNKADSYNQTKYYQNTKPYYPKPTPPDLQYEEIVPYRAYTGNPNINQGKDFSKLQNLKCKKLSDFKWYKDIFLTRVQQRPDNANPYWKEKIIAGLPKLFSNKVRDKMVRQMGWSDWSQMDLNGWTYGEIIATINIVAMQLCNDLRLKRQLKH
ncbi:hypothetical protein Ddye_005093 [Dipteronia dyeriana]|uniref:Uncharacterized protein n=1 Tax=Dipteronia dyeriana TaxID=168575 RepID=A0AAD9XFH9_9ROSI|nr:hypothetical protein Ddye_005093 [Dipteronia dyeriana]